MENSCTACLTPHIGVDDMDPDFIHRVLDAWQESQDGWWEVGGRREAPHPLLGKIAIIEQVGGEGQGDHAHLVWQIGSRLFRKDGYHQSHDGTHFDGEFYVVHRREKTVTVYE